MLSYVSKYTMESECPGVYDAIPAQFRDKIPTEIVASSQNAMIFRAGFDVMPGLVNDLFARLRYREGEDWPFWKLVGAFYLVQVRIGPNSAMRAGEKIYSTMPWPPQVQTVADALRFTEVAYFESHNRAPADRAGGWRVERDEPGKIVLVDSAPYPCHVQEGVIAGISLAFAKNKPMYKILDEKTAKRNGGTSTRYEISFLGV